MQSNQQRRGFTLVEVLVVIIIIGVLMAILIPVVGKVRLAARTASTEAFLGQLARAIEDYQTDFRSYPGPLSNGEIAWTGSLPQARNFPGNPPFVSGLQIDTLAIPEGFCATQSNFKQRITMAENLVLGLLGGLKALPNNGSPVLMYDPRLVGGGAFSLNVPPPGNPNAVVQIKRHKAYLEAMNLSWRRTEDQNPPVDEGTMGLKTGHFKDDAGIADDTIIPEFVDQYTDAMPILYLRPKKGSLPVSERNNPGAEDNGVVTYDKTDASRDGHYDLHQILGYTKQNNGRSIGVGKKSIEYYDNGSLVTPPAPYHGLGGDPGTNSDPNPRAVLGPVGANYYYPYNAYPYFRNNALSSKQGEATAPVAQNKDGFILISAGPDRIYGTRDDITNFGGVGK